MTPGPFIQQDGGTDRALEQRLYDLYETVSARYETVIARLDDFNTKLDDFNTTIDVPMSEATMDFTA